MTYTYAEVCIGAKDRGKVYDMTRVDTSKAAGLTDVYLSMFRFAEDVTTYVKENNGIKGYDGAVFSDWLYIDIDHQDLHVAKNRAIATLQKMEDYGVDLTTCRIWFSGSKGIHIGIPSKTFGATPSQDLPHRFRRMALFFSPDCDAAIYNTTRIFRLENTINSKSGLFKVEMDHSELLFWEPNDIRKNATNPRPQLDIEEDVDVIEGLKEMYDQPIEKKRVGVSSTNEGLSVYKTCVAKMLAFKGHDDFQCNNAVTVITAHLKESGLTHLLAWVALCEWNDGLAYPMDSGDLQQAFESSWNGGYSFGCNHPMKKQYCDPACVLYKEEFKKDFTRGVL